MVLALGRVEGLFSPELYNTAALSSPTQKKAVEKEQYENPLSRKKITTKQTVHSPHVLQE